MGIRTKNRLTTRQMQITSYIAWGYLKKEIADELEISYNTVDNHVRNIYEKLGIGKETDLTRWYFFQKLDVRLVNPFKRAIAVFFLALSLTSILGNHVLLRIMRAPGSRVSTVRLSRGGKRRRDEADYMEFAT